MLLIKNLTSSWSSYRLATILLPALLFITPLSSSGKSIILSLSVIALILSPQCRTDLYQLLSKSWCQALLALFAFALLACLWSPASLAERWLVVEKYSKFLYLPILVVGFQQQQTRSLALNSYLLALFLTCVMSILFAKGIIHINNFDADTLFRNHIMTGLMMSFAAYLSAWFCYRSQGVSRIIYGLLLFLFSYQVLFICEGRTGYVLYLLLLLLFTVQVFSRKYLVMGILLMGMAFLLCFQFSPSMQEGYHKIINEWQHYQDAKNQSDKTTSLGFRLQFHEFAKNLFVAKPILGNGTGSYTYLHRVMQPIPFWYHTLLEPHSQYWLTAAEFGSAGLLIYFWLYASLAAASWRLKELRPVALGILAIFAAGNFSDSLLFYSGSGYFFILFMALCLGENSTREGGKSDSIKKAF